MRSVLALALLAPLSALADPGAGVSIPAPPATFSGHTADDAPAAAWWTALGDPRLTALVEDALAGNRDLAVVRERVRAADALHFQALTPLLPSLSLDGNLSATPASLRFAQFTGGEAEGTEDEGLYYFASTTFNASLDVDVSGRSVLGVQAATQDVRAARADADQLAATIASRVGGAWLDAGLQASRLSTLERLASANRDVLQVVELRFARGEASAVDILQQRQQVASLEAQVPLVRAARTVAEQQLVTLLGRMPENVPTGLPDALPELSTAPSPGSPADLLDARPDLRAAELRLTSAWQRRVASERGFLPTLRLTANAGWSFTNNAGASGLGGGGGSTAAAFGQLEEFIQGIDPSFPGFDLDSGSSTPSGPQQWFTWGFGGSFSVPIFNGGRAIASLKSARASERIAAEQLASSRIAAWSQVEAARATDTQQQLRLDAVRAQRDAARAAYDAARSRYAEGIGDYLTVLTTLVSLQNAELSALQAHRDALAARISLHDALGGAWTERLHEVSP